MGVTATGARAGVWTPDAGSAYQRLAFNFFRNDASFSAGRDRREGFKEFTNTNLTYYLEDGIRDRLAFFGSLPAERLTHRTKGRNEVETFGFGDVNLGLRYRLWNRGVVFSTQFLFKAPYLYDRRDRLPLGNRQEDFHLRRGSDRTLGATLVARNAGINPKSNAVNVASVAVNPNTRQSGRRSTNSESPCVLSKAIRNLLRAPASNRPDAAPSRISGKLSQRSWQIKRPCVAPSDRRTANSRTRALSGPRSAGR